MESDRESLELPVSQRITIPSPLPFATIADRQKRKNAGSYLIVNERGVERIHRERKRIS